MERAQARPEHSGKRLVSVREAARILGIPHTKAYQLANAKRLPGLLPAATFHTDMDWVVDADVLAEDQARWSRFMAI